MMKNFIQSIALASFTFLCFKTQAQINYVNGTAVTENFNGMGASPTAALPTHWKVSKSNTERANPTGYSLASGSVEMAGGNNISNSAGNGIYRLNAGNNTNESAIGGLSSGSASKSVFVYVALSNTSTATTSSFDITYNVEKYRNGTNSAGFSIQMFYSTNGTTWTSMGSNFLTAYATDANNNGFTPAPLASATVNVAESFTPSVAVPVGGTVYFAWRYSVTSGATTSNAQLLGVDDVSITPISVPSTTPVLTASATSLTAFNYSLGTGPSASQSFDLTGANLDGTSVTVSPPTNFEVSTDNITFSTVAITIPYTAGSIAATTIYTRLAGGLSVNTYSGNVSISGGGAGSTTVALSGEVSPPPPGNDDCIDAYALTLNAPATNGTLLNATSISPFTSEGDVWYTFTPTYNENYTFTLSNFSGDADLYMFNQSSACPSSTTSIASSTTTFSIETFTVPLQAGITYYIQVSAFNIAAKAPFDIRVTAPAPCVTPSSLPSSLSFGTITHNSIAGNFVAASPSVDKYLVVVSTNPTLNANPVDLTTYSNGQSLGGGTVVSVSSSTNFVASGLLPNTNYYFFVFPLNDNCANGPLYLTTSPLSNQATTASGPCISEGFASGNTPPNGWVFSGLGSVYTTSSNYGAASPSLKMDDSDDQIVTTSFPGEATLLSFWIKGQGANAGSSLLVEGYNGTTWVSIATINPLPATGTTYTFNATSTPTLPNAISRFRFTYTKDIGNLSIDDITVNCQSVPLPVSISSFDAMKQNNTTNLTWTTVKEDNNKGFEIERSNDSKSWSTIDFVSSKAINNNSQEAIDYVYVDAKPLTGANFYRLKQIDFDGAHDYSSVRKVNFDEIQKIYSIYPNPAQDKIKIEGLSGTETVKIYNALGNLVKSIQANTNQINISDLAAGVYNIQINSDAQMSNQKLVIVK